MRLARCSRWIAIIVAGAMSASSAAFAQAHRAPRKPPPSKPTGPAQPSKPKAVDVTVVELAAGRAYVQPGAQSGVRRTSVVTLKGKDYRVVQSTDSYAVIDLTDDSVHEKDKGRATVVAEDEDKPAELPAPRPLSTWQSAWTPEPPPAESQQPAYVPIGDPERNRRLDVTLAVSSGGLIPLRGEPGSAIAFVDIGARIHDEPFTAPVAFDFDGSVQQWAAADLSSRVGGSTRSVVWVRELMASYRSAGWYAGMGRMRYAASTLGTLDGARAQAPLGGGFSLGAFGGFLPNPLGGELSLSAQRFGVEAKLDRPDSELRPQAALVAHGSMFGGALDERRLSGVFGLYPGRSRIGGHFEVSAFDAGNPWKAAPFELTAAGVDQSIRFGRFELSGRFDLLQPERSRWLASYLPTSWLCRTVPAPVGQSPVGEPCDGASSTRALGSVSAGMTAGVASFTVGGTAIGTVPHQSGEPRVLGAFATGRVVRIARVLRLEAAGSYSTATYVDMFGGTVGPGLTLLDDALDVSVYYRLTELQYSSVSGYSLENGVGGAAVVFPNSTMMFTVQGEGMTGTDVKSLFVFGSAVWRPRL